MNHPPLLRTPIPPELRDEWAARLAEPEAASKKGEALIMIFRLGAEKFALPVQSIEEVTPVGVIRPLPHARTGLIRGITNVRGQIRLCVWLERLLQTQPSTAIGLERLVVLIHEGWRVAIVIDEMIGIESLAADGSQPLPSTHAGLVFAEGWLTTPGAALLNISSLFAGLRQQLR